MKKILRLIAMVLSAAMLFASCGNKTPNNTDTDNKGNSGEKVLNYYMSDTPETLNPHTTASNYELLSDMIVTLYRQIYDVDSKSMEYVPALAEGEPIPEDDTHKVWTIKIAKGNTFADGTAIDAKTVEYSIKMLDDPKLANRNMDASNYVNGVKYTQGECDWSEVGFKVIDDYTIKITFDEGFEPESAKDVRILYSFIGTGIVHPATYEACLNADKTECSYGSSLDKFVASGLYNPTSLIQGQYLELTKRTDGKAPLADVYTPDKACYYCVSDSNTAVQLFEQGKIDVVVANQAAYDEYPGAHYAYSADNMGIYVNGETPTAAILKDVNFRYALYWGLDRATLVKAVFPTSKPNPYMYLPFATMPDPEDKDNKVVNYYETEEAKAVRIDGHELTSTGYDENLAKEYFDKAYKANGGQKVVISAIYSDTSDISKTWAEAIQRHYQTLFGEDRLQIDLQATPGSIIYEEISREKMNYDICLSCGWYNNATAPWNNSNWVYSGPFTYNTQYCTIADDKLAAEWDDVFYKCALYDWRWDAQKKLEATARLEEILYNDCCFIPAYSRGYRYFFSSKITPVMEVGNVDLLFCLMQSKFN